MSQRRKGSWKGLPRTFHWAGREYPILLKRDLPYTAVMEKDEEGFSLKVLRNLREKDAAYALLHELFHFCLWSAELHNYPNTSEPVGIEEVIVQTLEARWAAIMRDNQELMAWVTARL